VTGTCWSSLTIARQVVRQGPAVEIILPLGIRGSFSLLANSPGQFRGSVSSLYHDIALDGRILHDPRGFAAERFGALRRRMAELGLRRERTPEGFDWRWETTPPVPWTLFWSP
jgi:hypothetical protein